MTGMKASQRKRLAKLDRMKRCEREGLDCNGRITFEHCYGRLIGGKHVPDSTIIALCWYHHLGAGMNKEINKAIAYNYITEGELDMFRTEPSRQEREWLWRKYPEYRPQDK